MSAQAAHVGAQADGALAGFEAMLATLFGVEAAGDTAPATGTTAGTKTSGKTVVVGKALADDGKAKTGDDQTAATDPAAPATADINLVLLLPVVPQIAAVSTPAAPATEPASGGAAAQPVSGGASDRSAITAALTQLAAGPATADGDTAPAKTSVLTEAAPAASAAIDATATAKVDLTIAPRTTAAPAPTPQAPALAPQAPATEPPPPAPVLAATAAIAAASDAAATAAASSASETPQVAPPTAPREKGPAPKGSTRIDGAKAEAAPGSAAALTAKAANALQTVAEAASQGGLDTDEERAPVLDVKTETAGPTRTPADPATSATTTPASLIHAAAIAVRGAPQTVANLAAQIVRKLDGRSTQFNVQLDPIGLGKVDVRIAIAADGRMSAAMSFDTPQAAAELKARSGELQQAMEQAGFDMTGGMSFDVASDRGQGGQAQQQQSEAGAVFRGRAFQAALDTTADVPPPQLMLRRSTPAGVDIRI